MLINISIAIVLIFIGHNTRDLELANEKLLHKIDEKKQEININQIEFTLHNNSKYLSKLFSLYTDTDYKKDISKVIKLSEFSGFENKEMFRVDYK